MSLHITHGPANGAAPVDPDEALCTRLRDLALVDLDALVVSAAAPQVLVATFADDVLDALREARTRIAVLRTSLGGPDPLNVLDQRPRQRASDTAADGAIRIRHKLVEHATAARSLARLSDLAAALSPKLFEADRRR